MRQPRKPNQKELEQLTEYVAQGMTGDAAPLNDDEILAEAEGFVENAYIAVFDNYITDCPGYAGKLMSVVWSGAPEFYEVFIWGRDGKLDHVDQGPGFSQDEDSKSAGDVPNL